MGARQATTEEWIAKAKARWKGLKEFGYSKVVYKGLEERVLVYCPDCKDFINMIPSNHLRHKKGNTGCPECGKRERGEKTLEKHIQQFNQVHGKKYDYSKVIYKNNRTDVTIICPKHGEFDQTPTSHKEGQGCWDCYVESRTKDQTGERYGKLTITRQASKKELISKGLFGKGAYWWVQCACGRDEILKEGKTFTRKDRDQSIMSCLVCSQRTRARKERNKFVDSFMDKQFGYLTVIREWSSDKHRSLQFMCICKCGNTSTPQSQALLDGRSTSCGCKPTGEDSFTHYVNDPKYADKDTVLYFVEIRKKYQKIGIAYDVKQRFGSDCTDIYYERIMPRAKARAVECICLEWTKSNIPKLPKKWKEWDGNTELRNGLDIQNIINMMNQLAEESEDMTWQELWKKYGLSTGAEPAYAQPDTFQVDTLTSDQSTSSSY
jgi:hypothetical protein